MNILFLSLLKLSSFEDHNIYADLLRELIKNKHNVYAVCPIERRYSQKTNIKWFGNSSILSVKTPNIQKTNIVEKGIGTLAIKGIYIRAIKKYFKNIKFDLILYSTPPITLFDVVKRIKKRDNAKTYLMLKDIFPQNAVDLGMMKKTGPKSLVYKYFRRQERNLYKISDRIGCMSQANVDYVLKANPDLNKDKVEIFPNCIEIQNISLTDKEKKDIRTKYGLPQHKKIFVYGGNLGKPQDIPFIIECLKIQKESKNAFFLIVGDGTEYFKIESYLKQANQSNAKLLSRLPNDEFNKVLASCDVGLIFLDHRFTIPNFPSRLLSYMQAKLPILACTDVVSDIGKTIVDGGFGWWCESLDPSIFAEFINDICNREDLVNYSIQSDRMLNNYSVHIWANVFN